MSQTADGRSVDYLWDAYSTYGDVVLEADGSGTLLAAYTLANGQLIAIPDTRHYDIWAQK